MSSRFRWVTFTTNSSTVCLIWRNHERVRFVAKRSPESEWKCPSNSCRQNSDCRFLVIGGGKNKMTKEILLKLYLLRRPFYRRAVVLNKLNNTKVKCCLCWIPIIEDLKCGTCTSWRIMLDTYVPSGIVDILNFCGHRT